jgi:predicted HicB family RNase H-like nuclease
MGKIPDVPASGRLILRIPAEIHSRAAIIARTEGISLNTWVTDAVREKLSEYSANIL